MSKVILFKQFIHNLFDTYLPIFAAIAIVCGFAYGAYQFLSDIEVSESRYEEMMAFAEIKGVQPLILQALEDGKVQHSEFFEIKRQSLKFTVVEAMESQ